MKIALAQFNPTVGDVIGNASRIIKYCKQASELGAAVIVFPELAISGYPPEDLLLREDFLVAVEKELERITMSCPCLTVVIGYPEKAEHALYNSVAVLSMGGLLANYRKQQLPNYGVFDEKRYFTAGTQPCVFDLQGVKIGLTICEDVWTADVCAQLKQKNAELIINLNASPFDQNKTEKRVVTLQERVNETKLPIVYVNQVGGQDELVFDGASFAMNAKAEVIECLPEFEEALACVEMNEGALTTEKCNKTSENVSNSSSKIAKIYQALVLGVKDYVEKNGFQGAVLGLSGGIDSALTLAIAADALGGECIEAVSMPSRYTADMSNEDAMLQAKALNVSYQVIPIEPAVTSFAEMLEPIFTPCKSKTQG
jgi:NAD+ synthase (glutamine-hydrolysing)